MRVTWFHLFAVLSAKALEEGDEAIEAEQAEQFDAQAQAEHGIGYAELKEYVDDAVATARKRLTDAATAAARKKLGATATDEEVAKATVPPTEEELRAAINSAAEGVFRSFPKPPSRELAPEVADEDDDEHAGGGA